MIAKVIVDISNSEVDKIFDYLIPSNFELSVGDRGSGFVTQLPYL